MTERHPKDIVIGRGVICWGHSWLGGFLFEGWHLPGGRRTISRAEAEAAAAWIDSVIR